MIPSAEWVRFTMSGTEATMLAMRDARAFTGRDLVIRFAGHFHGWHDYAMAGYQPPFDTSTSTGVPKVVSETMLVAYPNNIESVRELLDAHPGEVAAVIVEPGGGSNGIIPTNVDFLRDLRALTTERGVVLIFDEVMTGFRVARGGAQEIYGIHPDLTALGKVIGGGLPVGAFGGRAAIMDQLSPLGPVYQAGTLSGNPLALAAGLAQLRELERIDGWNGLEKLGAQLEQATRKSLGKTKLSAVFHRIGSMFCLFFTKGPVTDLKSARRSDPDQFARFFNHCLDAGVYFAPSQFETGFISTAHQPAQIEETARIVRDALEQISR